MAGTFKGIFMFESAYILPLYHPQKTSIPILIFCKISLISQTFSTSFFIFIFTEIFIISQIHFHREDSDTQKGTMRLSICSAYTPSSQKNRPLISEIFLFQLLVGMGIANQFMWMSTWPSWANHHVPPVIGLREPHVINLSQWESFLELIQRQPFDSGDEAGKKWAWKLSWNLPLAMEGSWLRKSSQHSERGRTERGKE